MMKKLRIPGRKYPKANWMNTVLQKRLDYERATEQVETLGLPSHGDQFKNWTNLAALSWILDRVSPQEKVLDAGAETYSVLLPWLMLYGYRHLLGINLTFRTPQRLGFIRYQRGNVEDTRLPAEEYSVVTCMSVVEHGVDLPSFLAESYRLLRPGGFLIISTDYWPEALDTKGQYAFGVPIKVFCRAEIEALLALSADMGFRICEPVNLDSKEKAVNWAQFDLHYTFLIFCLQKPLTLQLPSTICDPSSRKMSESSAG